MGKYFNKHGEAFNFSYTAGGALMKVEKGIAEYDDAIAKKYPSIFEPVIEEDIDESELEDVEDVDETEITVEVEMDDEDDLPSDDEVEYEVEGTIDDMSEIELDGEVEDDTPSDADFPPEEEIAGVAEESTILDVPAIIEKASQITRKDTLESFARKYGVELDKRETLKNMVAELEKELS